MIASGAQTNDFAAATLGQLKWVARMAFEELEANLPGGAGTNAGNLINSFSLSNNYLAVNLGQLKNVAKPFYDRLMQAGLITTTAYRYPWTSSASDDADHAMANIGQLKNVFSFEIPRITLDIVQTQILAWVGDTNTVCFRLSPESVTNVLWQISPLITGGARFTNAVGFPRGVSASVLPGRMASAYTVIARLQLPGHLPSPVDTDTALLTVASIDGVEIVQGATGNTFEGPGNSPANRALVGRGVPLTSGAIMAPAGVTVDSLEWAVFDAGSGGADGDSDGIFDDVDAQPAASSDEFSDVPILGGTSGLISQRGDRTFQVFDMEGSLEGVRVIANAGAQPAEIRTTGTFPETVIGISAENAADFILSASSVEIHLLSGSLLATAQGIETTVSALLAGRSGVIFDLTDPQTLTVVSDPASQTEILISVNGAPPTALLPGQETATFFTSDIDGDGVLDGTDERPTSDMKATVVVEEDTGVPNRVNEKGSTIMDLISAASSEARNHGDFVSRVAHALDDFQRQGLITGAEQGAIQKAAAKSGIGKLR